MLPSIPVSLPSAVPLPLPGVRARGVLRGRLLRRLLGIHPAEATFARRGFAASSPVVRDRLERVGFTFLDGYHAALESEGDELAARLDMTEPVFRGFGYEGAAMALALLDQLTPWRPATVQEGT